MAASVIVLFCHFHLCKANPDNLEVDLPHCIEAGDLTKLQCRNGHFVMWSDSDGKGWCLGKATVWGTGYPNLSVHCKCKGHGTKCKRAVKTTAVETSQAQQKQIHPNACS